MQALYLADKLQFCHDRPRPVPAAGEALVRVLLAGICGTDLELLRGYHGFRGVPGHEFVGIVEELVPAGPSAEPAVEADDGPPQGKLADIIRELAVDAPTGEWVEGEATPPPEGGKFWLGKRVVASINIGPGADPRHAPDRTVLGILGRDGAFADYLTVPLRNLHEVPAGLTDVAAVFCEPLAAATRMTERLRLGENERVAVVGPGRLGLLCAEVLRLLDYEPTVLGHRPESLALPMSLGYATDLSAYLADNSFDVVVECSGSPDGLAEAVRLTRPLGRVAMKSTYVGDTSLAASAIVVKELSLVGSRCGSMDIALRLLATGHLNYDRFVTAEYPLHEGERAFRHAAEPGALKVLLNPWHRARMPEPKGEAPRPGE